MAKVNKLSVGAIKALEMVKGGCKTAQDMKVKGFDVNSAHLTVLVNREYCTSKDVFLVCGCCGHKRKVKAYEITQKGQDFKGE